MSADAVVEAKAAIRAQILAKRDALSAQQRAYASLRIQHRILALAEFARARMVMAYCSFGSELDTSFILAEVYARAKTLVLPRIDRERDTLDLFAVSDLRSDLVANAWRIREPRAAAWARVDPAALDFILVPGVAFDARCGRLGYGKAYYDRLLHACVRAGGMPITVAGTFGAQMVDSVPMEAHDVRVGSVVTEIRFIGCQP